MGVLHGGFGGCCLTLRKLSTSLQSPTEKRVIKNKKLLPKLWKDINETSEYCSVVLLLDIRMWITGDSEKSTNYQNHLRLSKF